MSRLIVKFLLIVAFVTMPCIAAENIKSDEWFRGRSFGFIKANENNTKFHFYFSVLKEYSQKNISSNMLPYLMCGIDGGYKPIFIEHGTYSNVVGGNNSRDILYDIGIGTLIKVTKNLLLDLHYKHQDLGLAGMKFAGRFSRENSKVQTRELMLDIVYKF